VTAKRSDTPAAEAAAAQWRTDVLGEAYQARTIRLPAEADGDLDATLVRRRAPHPDGRALLYLHGFSDYFFQTELAEYFTDQGIDFYALDLRRYGRSLRHHHTPNYVTDLRDYFVELDAAMRIIRDDGASRVAVNAHSTGGLIAALWAHDVRNRPPEAGGIDGLLLNSPWLDVAEPTLVRLLAPPTLEILARVRPQMVLPWLKSGDAYGRSLHRDYQGEWSYDLTPKPLGGFPIRAGWLRAVLRGQRQLHNGLSIQCPVLVLCSARSAPRRGGRIIQQSDAVLDVERIARWSVALGPRVTICRVDGGVHDLVLSAVPVRKRVYEEMSTWLDLHFPAEPQ
jgi:alpha-beta hydrolase superfamily lysophospholipase